MATSELLLTPVEARGDYYLKRDDLYTFAGVAGGKARSARALVSRATAGVVTAGARHSPQVEIVAHIARHYGLPCRCHVPAGADTPELRSAAAAGAELVRWPAGYNTVIKARAREDAAKRGWLEVPFGMECEEAITETAAQVENLPSAARLVVPVGSGMSLAGILHGLAEREDRVPVLAVACGADATRRLDTWAPGWRFRVDLVPALVPYSSRLNAAVEGVPLDPVYEAKCVPFLEPGDCLWVVGIRNA